MSKSAILQPLNSRDSVKSTNIQNPAGANIFSDSVDSKRSSDAGEKKAILNYIIAHAANDQRPYLAVKVFGRTILGLLDSGATCTIVGVDGWRILQELGMRSSKSDNLTCTVANGETCRALGKVAVPLELMGRICVIDVLIVPELSHGLVLGMDFWLRMGIVPDLGRNEWHFGDGSKEHEIASVCVESDLTEQQKTDLRRLLDDKFGRMDTSLGLTTLVEHEILTDSPPIKQRYYPVSPHRQAIIDEELQKMLDSDVIEPSKSGWSSPVILVPKKDGTYRFCVDYRRLNSVTKKDAYPIPYVSAILDSLRNSKYLSSLDIKSAYWQISVKESSRECTAFTVPGRGLFHFKRMPFGLTNAPATFQRLIDTVLGADLQPYVLVYLDDIVIISPDFRTHLEILTKVFDRLHAAGLTLNREKCQFCRPELRYLGYIVDKYGLRVDPQKVEALLSVPSPKNVSQVRSFIGMASWYRRFIPSFSQLVAPLTALTKKRHKWSWTDECEESFNAIKQHLVSAPVLTCPDFSRPFKLQTDASSFGIGAVLTQDFDDGERPICFLSRSLSAAERNYSTTERECLAVIWAVEKLRSYLEGVHFTVITDHYSLVWLDRLKSPTGRLARWSLRLQAFDFTIVHRKGKEHVVPDFLSRSVPVTEQIDVVDTTPDVVASTCADKWYNRMLEEVHSKPHRYPQWRVENEEVFKYVKCKIPELSNTSDYWKKVVPKEKRLELLRSCHDSVTSGHLGAYKTYWKLHDSYYWPKMYADVASYVRRCKVCAAHKPEQKAPAGMMGSRPKVTRPWEMISLDFVGPLPRSSSGHKYILVISDYFSKFVHLVPLRAATSQSLVKHVEEDIFLLYGVPRFLICDNGVQMKSKEFKSLCASYQCKILYTALYCPRADPAERVNRVVKTMISSYVKEDHRKWDKNLAAFACAVRVAKHETIGYSPFYVNFGRNYVGSGVVYDSLLDDKGGSLVSDIERRGVGFRRMFADVAKRLQLAHERGKKVYDLRRRPVSFQPGDRVWRRNKVQSDAAAGFNAKLAPKFLGPFKVRRRVGTCSYEIEDDGGKLGIWHVQDLKSAMDQPD